MRPGFKPPKVKNDMTAFLSHQVKNKRVSVFIDAANLYHSAITAELKIDFVQIAAWFEQHCQSVQLNFYTAFDPADTAQSDFFGRLEQAHYRVIKKPIKTFENLIKGNMDIELAVDSIMHKDLYDVLVLLSGDGDFHYLIKTIEEMNKRVILLGVGGFTSYDLHKEADSYFFLNRIRAVWQTPARKKTQEENYIISTDDFHQAYFEGVVKHDYASKHAVFDNVVAIPSKANRTHTDKKDYQRPNKDQRNTEPTTHNHPSAQPEKSEVQQPKKQSKIGVKIKVERSPNKASNTPQVIREE